MYTRCPCRLQIAKWALNLHLDTECDSKKGKRGADKPRAQNCQGQVCGAQGIGHGTLVDGHHHHPEQEINASTDRTATLLPQGAEAAHQR